MKTSRDLLHEDLDLSFLSPEEEQVIREVLERDEYLKERETGRIRRLRVSVPDPVQLKVMTGEWFHELRARRHGRQSEGTEVVRSSIRRKKTATRTKTFGDAGERTKEKEKGGVQSKEDPLPDMGQATVTSFVNPAFREPPVEKVQSHRAKKSTDLAFPGIAKPKTELYSTAMGTATIKDSTNPPLPSNKNSDYFKTPDVSHDPSAETKTGQNARIPSEYKENLSGSPGPQTNQLGGHESPANRQGVNRLDTAYLEADRVMLVLPPELIDQPEKSDTVMSLEPNTPSQTPLEVSLMTVSLPDNVNPGQSIQLTSHKMDSIQVTAKQPHRGEIDPKDSAERDSAHVDSLGSTAALKQVSMNSSSVKRSTAAIGKEDSEPVKTTVTSQETAEDHVSPETSRTQHELKIGSVGLEEKELTDRPIPKKRERQVPAKPERKRDSIGTFALSKQQEKTDTESTDVTTPRKGVKEEVTAPRKGVKADVTHLKEADKRHVTFLEEVVELSGAGVRTETMSSKEGTQTHITSSGERLGGEVTPRADLKEQPMLADEAVTEEVMTSGKGAKNKVLTSGEQLKEEAMLAKKAVTEEVMISGEGANKEVMTSGEGANKEVMTSGEKLRDKGMLPKKAVTEEVWTPGKKEVMASGEGIKGAVPRYKKEVMTSGEGIKGAVPKYKKEVPLLASEVNKEHSTAMTVLKDDVTTSGEGVKGEVMNSRKVVLEEVTPFDEVHTDTGTVSLEGVKNQTTTSREAGKEKVKGHEVVSSRIKVLRAEVKEEIQISREEVKAEFATTVEGIGEEVTLGKDGVKGQILPQHENSAAAIPTIILSSSSNLTEAEEDEGRPAGHQEVTSTGSASVDVWEDESAYSDDDHSSVSSYGSEFYDKKAYGSTNALSVSGRTGSMLSVYSDAGDFGDVTVQGSVELSLQYSPGGELLIGVEQCQDLAYAKPRKQRTDPYVKTYLNPDKSRNSKRKTSIKKRTVNPIFGETLKYKMSLEELRSKTLSLSVWHNDPRGRNIFLGQVELELGSWDWGYTALTWYNLMPKSPKGQEGPEFQGWLTIALKYNPGGAESQSGEINVWLKEARELKKLKTQAVDSFVKCYMLPDNSKKSRQKTRVMKKSQDPIYNHAMVYDGFHGNEAREACCELTVWDHNTLSNQFLGGVRLSLGTGLSYGKKVNWMDSSGQEVALWERMLANQNSWVEGEVPLRTVMTPRK